MGVQEAMRRRRVDMPLIGRRSELERLVAYVTGASEAAGRVVLVRGEPGIGKTHLLQRAIDDLVGDGWTVLDVDAVALDRLVPYAGLRHAVAAQTDMLDSGLSGFAARLVATLDVDGERSLAGVHATAVRFFSALSDASPTVMTFDDLALVDDDTLMLVESLLRLREKHPLVLMGNLRKPSVNIGSALRALLERQHAEGLVQEIELGPLDDEAVERVVVAMLGEAPPEPFVSTVLSHSGGNPLFAVESVLNLDRPPDRDELHATHVAGSGDRRRAFLDRVLRDVPPRARLLGSAVSLLGVVGHTRIALAAELAGLSAEEGDATFDMLVDAGILRRGADGGYRVYHELVAEALMEEIGPAERWRWHRTAANRLMDLPTSPAVDLELAGHMREVAEFGDASAIAVLSRAGERTCASAPRSSIGWFEHALRLTPVGDPGRASVTARLARAFFLAGQPTEAVNAGTEALEDLSDGDARRRLVTLLVAALLQASEFREAAALVDRELARPGDHTWLAAQAAHGYEMVQRHAEAAKSARAAERHLPSAPVPERIVGLVHLAHMHCVHPRFDELLERWVEIERVAEGAPLTSQLSAHAAIGFMQASHGFTRLASTSIARAQRLLADTGWTLYRADVAAAQAQNAAHVGDWTSALSIIEPLADELVTSGSLVDLMALRAAQTDILANRGAWAAARRAAASAPSNVAHYNAVRVWSQASIDLLSGSLDAAAAGLERQLEDPTLPRWIGALLLSRLADVEIERGRANRAAERLAPVAGLGGDLLNPPTYVAVQLAWGRATGDIDALAAGLAVAEEQGLALLRGQAMLLLGARDIAAESNLTEAARVFASLGAAPWRRRAVVELRKRGLKIPRQTKSAATLLTETEMQIARLVEQGHGNREIAMTLFLQVKTVEAYLTRIYRKVGVQGRLGLARAVDAGLLD